VSAEGQRIGTGICYESIFGDFMADYSREGAQALAIITNDAWWGHTPGHEQHLLIGRLRAIEQRRYMARAGNTGISGFIDPLGQLHDTLSYARQGAKRGVIGLSSTTTGYSIWGDTGLILLVLTLCLWQGWLGYKNQANFNARS
jgi:apolipoprotein N-acyltransferase